MSTTVTAHQAARHTAQRSALAAARAEVESLTTGMLARLADCGRPEEGTEGADALDTARNAAADACEEHLEDMDPAEAADACDDGWDLVQAVSDHVWENVDGSATLIYTYIYRAAFAELDGWSEDPAGEYGPLEGMDKAAQVAVFMIMRRAADAVVERYAEAYTEAYTEAYDTLTEGLADEED